MTLTEATSRSTVRGNVPYVRRFSPIENEGFPPPTWILKASFCFSREVSWSIQEGLQIYISRIQRFYRGKKEKQESIATPRKYHIIMRWWFCVTILHHFPLNGIINSHCELRGLHENVHRYIKLPLDSQKEACVLKASPLFFFIQWLLTWPGLETKWWAGHVYASWRHVSSLLSKKKNIC